VRLRECVDSGFYDGVGSPLRKEHVRGHACCRKFVEVGVVCTITLNPPPCVGRHSQHDFPQPGSWGGITFVVPSQLVRNDEDLLNRVIDNEIGDTASEEEGPDKPHVLTKEHLYGGCIFLVHHPDSTKVGLVSNLKLS